MKMLGSILLFLLCGGLVVADARHAGMYSNMAYNEEGGDVLGIEIFVVYSTAGYWVLFQEAEGAPSEPILVKAQMTDGSLRFSLPKRTGYHGRFVGKFLGSDLVGSFEDIDGAQASHELKLSHRSSYWQ